MRDPLTSHGLSGAAVATEEVIGVPRIPDIETGHPSLWLYQSSISPQRELYRTNEWYAFAKISKVVRIILKSK